MKRLVKLLVVIIVGLALAIVSLAIIPGVGSATTTPLPRVVECTQGLRQPQLRPSTFILECATAGMYVSNITWASWTDTGAIGVGTIHVQTCHPGCYDGGWYQPWSVLIMLGRVRWQKISSTYRFTELSVWSLNPATGTLFRFMYQESLPG